MTAMKNISFWAVMPCSMVDVYSEDGESTPSAMSVNVYQTTQRHIPDDRDVRYIPSL
jgi:hypothetical protein